MRQYKEFRPTQFDSRGLGLPDQQDWLVLPVTQTRDSGVLARCNFMVALEMLGGESETVEVHRFGHWGPGWFEIIIVNPCDADKRGIAEGIEAILEEYSILDDSKWSEMEYEATAKYWQQCSMRDRMRECERAGVSKFAARRDGLSELPDRLYDRLREVAGN